MSTWEERMTEKRMPQIGDLLVRNWPTGPRTVPPGWTYNPEQKLIHKLVTAADQDITFTGPHYIVHPVGDEVCEHGRLSSEACFECAYPADATHYPPGHVLEDAEKRFHAALDADPHISHSMAGDWVDAPASSVVEALLAAGWTLPREHKERGDGRQ